MLWILWVRNLEWAPQRQGSQTFDVVPQGSKYEVKSEQGRSFFSIPELASKVMHVTSTTFCW